MMPIRCLSDDKFRTLSDENYRKWINSPNRQFVVSTRAGDEYLLKIEVGEWEAVKLFFRWTDDFAKALRLTREDVTKTFSKVVATYSAPRLICVA
jgi:hypothetical protein